MWRRIVSFLIFLTVGVSGVALSGQGLQTGALSGRASFTDGTPLPGVTITITSSALQGARSATTDVNGEYLIPGLPPGQYHAIFELAGMTTAEGDVLVPLGTTAVRNASMAVTPVKETVEVTAQVPPALVATEGAVNTRKLEIDQLPIGRQPFAIAELAPGLTDNTPNASQLAVSGAFAYDNVFLINGVDVNDNVLGSANTLFIEDAIDEVQVLTSGISAEYGRFSGGVVNVVTKSGGNDFSGSFRATFGNPSWTVETPYEKARGIARSSKLSKYYEGTAGGPIARDRLWFFGAGRFESSQTQSAYAQTGIPYKTKTGNRRFEAKLTGSLGLAQTVQGTYIDNQTDLEQPALGTTSIDPATYTFPSTPNRMVGVSYKGVVASRFFATAQYSQKWYGIRNQGGTATAIVDSPFLTRTGTQYQYNAPYFDSSDPEDRNNQQFTGSLSSFLSSKRFGSHDLKVGAERFTSTRVGGNSQSSTGYVFRADYLKNADGTPTLDANGRLIPLFQPGITQMQTWMPVRGARINVHTTSIYVADRWAAGPRWTFDLGLRYEHVRSDATGDIDSAKGDVVVPRFGASYDVRGDGRTVLQASYAHYAGKYNDVQFSRNTNVGNADRITGAYTGLAGQGLSFAAGFTPANYATASGTFPTANVFYADNLSAPITREITLSAGQEIRKGYVKAMYVWRSMANFVEDFITIDGGKTTVIRNGVNFGTFDNQIYRNSDEPVRDYQAIAFLANYRPAGRVQVSGDWTVQITNDGNFEGEARSNPAIPSSIGDYPEMLVADRNFPTGHLAAFQRHKVRVWGVYRQQLGRFGSVDLAPIFRYNSGLTYSLAAASVPLSAWQLAQNPGYARATSSWRQTLFFGERGSQFFKGYALLDLAVTYSVPIWRELAPWIKMEVLNALNNQKLISWDTTVTANTAGPVDQYGLPTSYTEAAAFGQATGTTSYPRPRGGLDGGRTITVALGVRF